MNRPPRTLHPDSPIARRRLAKGWTQGELARHAGISLNALKRAEAGALKTFPTETTRLIADALECAIDDLRVPRGTYLLRDFRDRA